MLNNSTRVDQDPKYYFGSRNGLAINPVPGVNYRPELLWFMPTVYLADLVINSIPVLLKNNIISADAYQKANEGYTFIDATAGIGGFILAAAESPNTSLVVGIEIEADRRAILRN